MKKSYFGRVFDSIKMIWRPQTIGELDSEMGAMISGMQALSGVNVDEESALTIPAFYNGVMQIANTVGSLPLPLYIRTGEDSRRKYSEHPLFKCLMYKANAEMSAYNLRRTMQYHAIVYGNGYAYIIRDGAYRVVGLSLMNPTRTKAQRNKDTGVLEYEFKNPDGTKKTYPKSVIFHIPGLAFDGVSGKGVVQLMYESLGLSMAYEEFTARFLGSGTHLGGALKLREGVKLTVKGNAKTKEDFKNKYGGLGKSHGIIVLEDGTEFQPLGMPLKDAELLASKIFQIQDIARMLNMPPHKLKELSRATYDNISSEQLSWMTDTIRPWLVGWESEISMNLVNPINLGKVYAEHTIDAILRADIKTRYEAYQLATRNGWMNRNEVRAKENMNPMKGKGGSLYTVQSQMADLNKLGEQPEPVPPPAPEPVEQK